MSGDASVALKRGDLFAGRFHVQNDPSGVPRIRSEAIHAHMLVGGEAILQEERNFWITGVDRETSAPVLIEIPPPGLLDCFEAEATARLVAAMDSPRVAPILHIGGGIVFAAPPRGAPRGTCSMAEAAMLAIEACEISAALHVAGISPLCFDPYNLRVVGDKGSRHIHWILPSVHELRFLGCFDLVYPLHTVKREIAVRGDSIVLDLSGLVTLFLTLQPLSASDPAMGELVAMARDPALLPRDVASLAQLFLPLARDADPGDLEARVARIPAVPSLPRRALDWDLIIAEGEALLAAAERRDDVLVAHPIAAAYHQRASRAWAAGDLGAALADTDRAVALDPAMRTYVVTRAVLLDALGRHAEARGLIDATLESVKWTPFRWDRRPIHKHSAADLARAHATRGVMILRDGDPAQAEVDLRCAVELAPKSAPYAHSLGAALYARGEIAQAADAELQSVTLDPQNTRYRWALVVSLLKLGRDDEAREHARAILAQEPEVAAHRDRFARLFAQTG